MVWDIWTTDSLRTLDSGMDHFADMLWTRALRNKGKSLMFSGTRWLPCWQSLSGTSEAVIPPLPRIGCSSFMVGIRNLPCLGLFSGFFRPYTGDTYEGRTCIIPPSLSGLTAQEFSVGNVVTYSATFLVPFAPIVTSDVCRFYLIARHTGEISMFNCTPCSRVRIYLI